MVGYLDVKIAFLSTNNEIAMYHEKLGIISDDKKNAIAFSGSMNESENAFSGNYEAFDVFCSWTKDSEHDGADGTARTKTYRLCRG